MGEVPRGGGVNENVLISFLLDFDEQVHQTHVRDLGERFVAVVLYEFMGVHGVALVLVSDGVQTDVRLDGPNYARLSEPFGSIAESEPTRFCDLVWINALKLVRLIDQLFQAHKTLIISSPPLRRVEDSSEVYLVGVDNKLFGPYFGVGEETLLWPSIRELSGRYRVRTAVVDLDANWSRTNTKRIPMMIIVVWINVRLHVEDMCMVQWP